MFVHRPGTLTNFWRHPDWLGSSRFASAEPARTKFFDVNYAPYGEDYGDSGTTDLTYTGQMQDTITFTYDFPARKFSSIEGRWLSPDPAGLAAVNLANPQTLDRYSYVSNSPLGYTDPLGLWCVWEDGTHDDIPANGGVSKQNCLDQGGHWDDFNTVTGIFQLDVVVTQINTIYGKFDYSPIDGMTLDGLDQTLRDYSVLGVDPSDQLNAPDFILSMPMHFEFQGNYAPTGGKLTFGDKFSCSVIPDATNEINELRAMTAGEPVSPKDEGHPEEQPEMLIPNIQINAQPKRSAGAVAIASSAIQREGGSQKAIAAAFAAQRLSQTIECLATNRH